MYFADSVAEKESQAVMALLLNANYYKKHAGSYVGSLRWL
jgi:hypothetical protein